MNPIRCGLAWLASASAACGAPDLVDYTVELDVIRSGYDGEHCWVHPRAGVVPAADGGVPAVVLTLQNLWLGGSDVFGPLHEMRSDDRGRTWSGPTPHAETLGRRSEPGHVTVVVSDFWPKWHAATGTLLGIGHNVRYRNRAVIRERTRETVYSVYDPQARAWTRWAALEMPAEPRFKNAGSGSVQRVDLPNGEILLPLYFKEPHQTEYRTAVARCAFDGTTLRVREIGRELARAGGRGLYEPSLAQAGGRFFLTMRNDETGYVATSRDGVNFDSPRRWRWDDGTELGTYNTQSHWVTHGDALFLVYTRRGLGNDHVFRHRAPLLMAQVDPERLVVLRATERILVPERGARLGNFGVTEVGPDETWVTVAEWMQGPQPRRILAPDNPWDADNRVYAAKIRFDAKPVSQAEARATARMRPRRLIFNNDGGDTRVPRTPLPKPADFLPLRIAPLAGTHVDTIVFDTTSGTFGRFAHATNVAERFLVREGRYQHNVLPDLLAAGTDPLRVVIEHARATGQEVFWTMRMNDTHDASNPLLIPDLKRKHPDLLFGTRETPPRRGQWSSVDYGRREVRDLAHDVIAEVASGYDVDGIELDFWRHPVFFRRTSLDQPLKAEDLDAMNDLMRRVRESLDTAGRRRGRAILLAVKLPDSVGYCRAIGLDVERWLREGWIDLLVFGGYFQLEPWTRSVELGRRHGIPVVACLAESRVRDEAARAARSTLKALRARALAAWAAGVDTIEMFNHFDPHSPLWRELGDPKLLRALPKTYFASVQGAAVSRSFVPADDFISVPTLTPDRPETLAGGSSRQYEMFIGDDLRNQTSLTALLRLRVPTTDGTAPHVWWNDRDLEVRTADGTTWSAAIPSDAVVPGPHSVTVMPTGELQLEDLSVEIGGTTTLQQ